MNMKQAKYIMTIAELGTVTAASKVLYVSQPALSQMLRQAEEELGMPIFDRSVSPMMLTLAGERYLQTANRIMEADAQLEMQISELKKEHSGRIRLGISVSRAIQIIPRLLPMFRERYPNVQISLSESGSAELEGRLKEGKIDLALAALEPTDPDIEYVLIEKETIGLLSGRDTAIAKRLPSGTPIRLVDAAQESFTSLTKNHSSRLVQDLLFRRYDFSPEILLETESLEVCRRLAMEANACMVIPDAYVDEYVQHMGGEFFPLIDYENHRHFYACMRKGRFIPSYTRELIKMVGKILQDRPTPASLE